MTKRNRTILFASFVVLFFILVPPIVLYADGYRVDFSNFSIVKVGALRINARPFPADVYVNGDFIESSSFLFRTTFVTDLLPQSYLIQVKKDGYQTWQKQLPVNEGSITSATTITLFPTSPLETIIQSNAVSNGFFPEANGRAAIIAYTDKDGSRAIGVYSSQSRQMQNIDIKDSAGLLSDVVWSKNAQKVLLVFTKQGGTISYIVVDNLTGTPTVLPINGLAAIFPLKSTLSRWQWSNDDSHLLMLASYTVSSKKIQQNLYYISLATNPSTDSTSSPQASSGQANSLQATLDTSKQDVKDFIILQDAIYTIESLTNIMARYSANLSNRTQISSTSYPADLEKLNAKVRLHGDQSTLFALHSDGQLFLFDQNTQAFAKIADGIRNIMPALDGLKVALQKDNEVYLYWTRDVNDVPNHKKGDMEIIWRLSEPIKSITWLSASYQYLAVSTASSLMISELDTRDGRNIVSYKQIVPSSDIVWDDQNQELLLVNKNNLVRIALDKIAGQ